VEETVEVVVVGGTEEERGTEGEEEKERIGMMEIE
jgi:hypothetical protein